MPTNEELQLADYIMKGLESGTKEITTNFIFCDDNSIYSACALGMAIIGKFGQEEAEKLWGAEHNYVDPDDKAAKILGISVTLAHLIDYAHCGRISAKKIALALREGTLETTINDWHRNIR